MKENINTHHPPDDNKQFADKNEHEMFASNISKLKELKNQELALNQEIAHIEYDLHKKKICVKPVKHSDGNGFDGLYYKCPYCAKIVGGYRRMNTSLKVAENIYKCEKCGGFFKHS